MLLAENRPFNNALVKPNAAVQFEVTVADNCEEPVVMQPVSGGSPQRANTTVSVTLERR